MLDSIAEFKSSPQIREKLLSSGMVKSFGDGDVLLRENAYIRVLPIVLEGAIKVIRTDEDGHEILVYYIRPGESCIMSFLGGLHHEKSKVKAVVEDHCEALIVPIEQLPALIKEYPQWLSYIFRLYQTRFEELLDVVNAITFKRMDERLLDFLHKKADILHSQTLLVTHEQLASELGTARVVISRLLKQLESDGLVQLGRHKITLV